MSDLAPATEARAPSDSPRPLLLAVSALLVGLSLAGCKQPAPAAARVTTVAVASASAPAPAVDQAISPFGSYLAARHAESVGDLGSAAEFMAEVVASGTASPALLRQSFAFMTSVGRLDDAVKLAERLVAEADKSPAPAVLLALEKARAGDFAAAAAGLEPLPRDGVGKLLMPLLLAWARMGMGETDSALGTLAVLGEARSLSAVILLHAALISDLAGRTDHARVNYEAAAEGAEISSFRVIEAASSFLIRTGDKERARALVRRFEDEFPGSDILRPTVERLESGATVDPLVRSAREGMAEALFAVAASLLRQGDENMALAYSHMALRLNPDLRVGLLLLAEVQEKLGRHAEAIESYTRLGADATFGWESRLRVATNLSELGRTDEAIARLEAMSLERPERHDALFRLGDVLRHHQRYAEAAVAYDRAVARVAKIEPGHWTLLYARGIALERSKQWPRAEADLLRALEFRPEQPLVLNYLGYSWADRGENLERAREMIERAVALRPNDGYIVDSLGWVHYRMGQYDKAVIHLERALELKSGDAVITDHLGDAYWQAGRKTEARFQWRRALTLDADEDLRRSIQLKLEHGLGATNRAANPG